jgi:hypothetical protein
MSKQYTQAIITIILGLSLIVTTSLLIKNCNNNDVKIETTEAYRDSVEINKDKTIKELKEISNTQKDIVKGINESNEKSNKKIKRIPRYNDSERDSSWSRYYKESESDSIPVKRWDILNKRARGLDSATARMEKDL